MSFAVSSALRLTSRKPLPTAWLPTSWPRCFSSAAMDAAAAISAENSAFSDRCNKNVVTSPWDPLPELEVPLAEFITQKWAPNGGHLGEKVAMIDATTGLQRTFADYHDIMKRVGAALKNELGVGLDSTVALYSPNHVDYLPISLAVSLCGAKLTPTNPMFTSYELRNILNRSRSSVLIAHKSKLDVALEAAKQSEHVKHVIVLSDSDGKEAVPEGSIDLASLKTYDGSFLVDTPTHVKDNVKTHPFLLPYSSGTTGLPKGVCLTHHNIVTNLRQYNTVEEPGFPEHHKVTSPLPFFHTYAYVMSMMYCGWRGQTIITMSGRFTLEKYCQLLEEHRPKRAHLVPPIILELAKNPIVDKYDVANTVQQIVSAAAPLSGEVEAAVFDRLGCRVKQAWGMSELSPLGTFNSDAAAKSGSVGTLTPSSIGKILDKDGNSLPAYQSGEFLIKGPQIMMGYLDAPEKTAECLSKDGWMRTGDVAHYDDEGYFFITDRIKELIKVRGYPVAPAELEALLLTHPSVQDVAVIDIPDERSGDLPRAYIVLKEGMTDTEEEMKLWVKDRVAPYKRLDGGVIFTDKIPKSDSGKILRRVLREQVADETNAA